MIWGKHRVAIDFRAYYKSTRLELHPEETGVSFGLLGKVAFRVRKSIAWRMNIGSSTILYISTACTYKDTPVIY